MSKCHMEEKKKLNMQFLSLFNEPSKHMSLEQNFLHLMIIVVAGHMVFMCPFTLFFFLFSHPLRSCF